ncbi:MAG: hypothetical protein ACLRWQ_16915 [Flavonifractor plautii]
MKRMILPLALALLLGLSALIPAPDGRGGTRRRRTTPVATPIQTSTPVPTPAPTPAPAAPDWASRSLPRPVPAGDGATGPLTASFTLPAECSNTDATPCRRGHQRVVQGRGGQPAWPEAEEAYELAVADYDGVRRRALQSALTRPVQEMTYQVAYARTRQVVSVCRELVCVQRGEAHPAVFPLC